MLEQTNMIRNKTTYYYECFSLGHENISGLVFCSYFYFFKILYNKYIYICYIIPIMIFLLQNIVWWFPIAF